MSEQFKEVNERPLLADTPLRTARMFHDAYERLAPQYGYETRQETRKWNPLSANGQLMQAVALEVLGPLWLEMERLRAQAQFISETNSGGPFTLQGQGPDALDAARYRYLRNVAEKNTDTASPIVCAGCGDDFDFLGGPDLDAAIDAEIASTK